MSSAIQVILPEPRRSRASPAAAGEVAGPGERSFRKYLGKMAFSFDGTEAIRYDIRTRKFLIGIIRREGRHECKSICARPASR
jgi:hypothetical protein